MSFDINWQALTDGPDGRALAEQIRDFIDERLQSLPLPNLIRSVRAQEFHFGDVAPQLTIKDICEPLPDFYESEDDDSDVDDDKERGVDGAGNVTPLAETTDRARNSAGQHLKTARAKVKSAETGSSKLPTPLNGLDRLNTSPLQGTATPGFLHGSSNLGYFHLPLSAGLSGTNTPLAAVAGAHFGREPSSQFDAASQQHQHQHNQSTSFSSISPPPTLTPPSRPTSRDDSLQESARSASVMLDDMDDSMSQRTRTAEPERSPEDLQIVFHIAYSGNIRLSMTAEVFLDYPMPSFVGIPLTINITGLTFDGVGIVAYIKRKAHVCFLAPEDADALVGGEPTDLGSPDETGTPTPTPGAAPPASTQRKMGGLIEDIKIESEMGKIEGGKQVLKNVGKIEKFLLEQVQKVFEDEFVYPSFWTFLV